MVQSSSENSVAVGGSSNNNNSSNSNSNNNSPVNYNSRTANNRVSVLSRNKKLVWHGLATNICYGIGAISFVAFSALDLNDRDREPAALVTYTIAFICFLLNALGELYIDIVHTKRGVRHGRYSKKNLFNFAISGLFVIGIILDFVAFFLWLDRKFVTEHRVLYASSHAWFVSAILVLLGQVPFVETRDVMEGLDDAGNLLFLLGCIIDCLVRYVDTDFATGQPPLPVARLEFSSSPVWLVSAICYIVADGLRVHKMQRDVIVDPSNGMTSP